MLVRLPNWLGDSVMALPTVRALREALPDAECVVAGLWAPPLLEAEPALGRAVALPARAASRLRVARTLRQAAVDVVVLLPNSLESALWGWIAGARWRVGYAGDGRDAFLTHPVPRPAGRVHQVQAYLDLLRPLGLASRLCPPTLEVTPDRVMEARRLLGGAGLSRESRPVGIALGAALGPAKLWPAGYLAALATRLEALGANPVFLGTPATAPLLAEAAARMPGPPRSLVGRDHVALLPALLRELAVLVSADSGPAHVAAAVGTPAVTLFGPTDPRLTAPLGDRQISLWRQPACAPCFLARCPIDHRCLTELTVDQVLEAVTQLRDRAP